jgi:pimeloyl-ACP methyl ester carboxylesterase
MTPRAMKKQNLVPAREHVEEERQVALPGGRLLSYMEFGAEDGVPVFGFHGTPGSRFMFRLAHEPAKRMGIRIIAPDRPGFGRSTFQRNRSLAHWAEDVRFLAGKLHLERFGVAGISGGGPYAVACAALLPDRVSAAVLVSPMGPVLPPEGPKAIGRAQHVTFRLLHRIAPAIRSAFAVGRFMFLAAPNSMYGIIMSRAGPLDWPILSGPNVRRNLLEGVAEGVRPGVRGAVEEMKIFGRPWNIPFEAIRAPTFLWQGTADRNVPVAAALQLAEHIPNCRVSLMEGAGHYWIFDNIDKVLLTMKQAMMEVNPVIMG